MKKMQVWSKTTDNGIIAHEMSEMNVNESEVRDILQRSRSNIYLEHKRNTIYISLYDGRVKTQLFMFFSSNLKARKFARSTKLNYRQMNVHQNVSWIYG